RRRRSCIRNHATCHTSGRFMTAAEQHNHARAFLKKAEEYLESAEDNLTAGRYTPAAGDAIHSGISAKDAIVTALAGTTGKGRDHRSAVNELKTALGTRDTATTAARALRELTSAKGDVEYGTDIITAAKAEPLARRARTLLELAIEIVRLRR